MKIMKYFKLFMLLLVACTFAACSDDDNNNTNGETTVSFANATLKLKESAGLVNIPIKVEGARNGDVSVVVKAEEVGESPAVEDKNYIITSGLNVGDRFVVNGVTSLQDGMEIKPITEAQYAEKLKKTEELGEAQGDLGKLKKAFGK